MGKRRKVAARTHRTAGGHMRHETEVQDGEEELDGLDTCAREPFRDRVRAEEHRGTYNLVWIGLANAARMAAEKPELELARLLGGDPLGHEAAEAGVDAIRALALRGID